MTASATGLLARCIVVPAAVTVLLGRGTSPHATASEPPATQQRAAPGRIRPAAPLLKLINGHGPHMEAVPSPGQLAEDSISERFVYPDGGAVRFVVTDESSGDSGQVDFSVEVRNEGDREFTVSPKDRWHALSQQGTPARLQANIKGPLVVSPRDSARFRLLGEFPAVEVMSGIRLRHALLGGEVEIRDAFEDVWPLTTVPAAYDPDAIGDDSTTRVELEAVVGPDGHVEQVMDVRPTGASPAEQLRTAARAALLRWSFAPARQAGTPVRTLHRVSFSFDKPRVFRTVVPGSASDLAKRIEALLRGGSGIVARIPAVGGFVVGQALPEGQAAWLARGLYVRCGDEPDGGGAWIALRYSDTFHDPGGTEACGCTWWSPAAEEIAPQALRLLVARLELPASPIRALTAQVAGSIPSGLPEAPGNGEWDLGAVGHLLRWSVWIASRPAGEPPPSPVDLPSAEAFIPAPLDSKRPDVVPGHLKLPKLVDKIKPVYPEVARRTGLKGNVTLRAIIDETGRVDNLQFDDEASPLTEAARQAVCCWRYKPATVDGRPIRVPFTVVVEFKL